METTILTLILFTPLAGALVIVLLPSGFVRAVKSVGLVASVITFALTVWLFLAFDGRNGEMQFVEKIPWEVETNINRLAAQWEERINAAIDGMHKQSVQYVKDETATIESLLSGARGRTEEIRQMIAGLKRLSDGIAAS